MILYSTTTSPNSAPVRLAIRLKGLDIALEPPPGGLGSTRFHAINPVGTIPCLVLDDGFVMPESVAIIDYLEDLFPEPALRPADPRARAEMRVLQRIAELGVLNQAIEVQALIRADRRQDDMFGARLTRLLRGLSSADLYLNAGTSLVGGRLTMADCHLAPALALVRGLVAAGSIPDLLASSARLADYLERARAHPVAGPVLADMAGA